MNVRFEQLKKSYAKKTVLDVEQAGIISQKITGIIGPNGAGKSTLLNIIAGLDTPTAGKVLYEISDSGGILAYTSHVPQRQLTLLFQQAYMIKSTVERNIAYPLKLRNYSKNSIDVRVKELMNDLELVSLAKARAKKLSAGETQKVAFARALSFKPRLLLLDEPTSNIDNLTTADIEAMLKKTNKTDATTILIVSHNLSQIKRLCDDVIFMHEGRIIEQGQASEVLEAPKDPRTRAFIEGELLI